MRLEISDWRNVPYAEAWDRQTACFDALVHAKQVGEEYVNHIILCEHPHVYTLGRSGKEGNMLLSEEQLSAVGASLYHIDRGGDITYHGPGQLVCYPILNLEEFSLGLKEYVHLLEEAVIRVCASYGITAGRVEKATGVWLVFCFAKHSLQYTGLSFLGSKGTLSTLPQDAQTISYISLF